MKKFIALALVTLGITVSARSFTVYDPTLHMQFILNSAQEIAKFVEMINNQVQQIQTLTDQLDEFRHYKKLFGDPNAVVLTTVQPLVNDARKMEAGQTLTSLNNTDHEIHSIHSVLTGSQSPPACGTIVSGGGSSSLSQRQSLD